MRRRAVFIVPCALIGVIVCAYMLSTAQSAALSDEEWDICEAVCRHHLSQDPAREAAKCGRFFLSVCSQDTVRRHDPPDSFLERFNPAIGTIKNGSEFNDDESGIHLAIAEIRLDSGGTAEVRTTSHQGRGVDVGSTLYADRIAGKWKIIREKVHWTARK